MNRSGRGSSTWIASPHGTVRQGSGALFTMADPIRFDPNAKFDNEVARMAEEHDADVVLKLADRKAATMAEGHSCAVCTESTEATHRMILHKDRGAPQTIEVCERHGMWLKEGAQPA